MLRRQYYLDASEGQSRFLMSANSSQRTTYSAGMVVGIISFCIGLIVLTFMEFLKLKIEHDSLSVGVAPQIESNNPDIVEEFDDTIHHSNNRSTELRPGESVHDDAHRQRILDEHADSRKQWQSQQQQQQQTDSNKTKGTMPTKLMAAVAMRNATQDAESDEDLHDLDDDDHSDDDSVFSFPSAMSGMSED